jgi:hypothetical protein
MVRIWRRAAFGVAVVVLTGAASAAHASAGTGWSIQPTPSPPPNGNGFFRAVSCPSATTCIAVGRSVNKAGKVFPLVEAWDGTSWSVQPTPSLPPYVHGVLNGVSCPSATTCIAVGNSVDSAGQFLPLVEAWDGTSWSIQSTTTLPPPDGYGILRGVSCTSASACTAVGSVAGIDFGSQRTLAERWDGTSWSVQSTPNPTGATASGLDGVSCTSPTACTAIGGAVRKGGASVLMAEVWNGTSWSLQSLPGAPAGVFPQLNAISCSSATACTAVGYSYTSSPNGSNPVYRTLAERWDGTIWVIQSTPNPTGSLYGILAGVSCPAPTNCTAVGSIQSSTPSAIVTLAERWNGTSWSIQSTPNPANPTMAVLNGVSCTSATACTAVGSNEANRAVGAPLVERHS